MNILLMLLFFASIHQEEYFSHIDKADFSINKPVKTELIARKGMIYIYYGYLPYWVDTTYYNNFQYDVLTHIAYFSVAINSDGSLGSIPNSAYLNKLLTIAHPRGIKIHMTFTIFGTTSVSDFLNNATARSNAINNISSMISTYSLDGANIDFEFSTSSVKDSFTDFIYDLANALHNHIDGYKEVYIAMPAVPAWYPGYDYTLLSDYSDGLFIMGYDYHYSGSSTAGPVAPNDSSSFWGYYAISTTIKDYKVYGSDPEKMILGIPYYGYDWPTNDNTKGSSTTGSGSAVLYKYAVSNASTYGYLWDDYSLTPWYTYYSSSYHQCWYDDSSSIYIKLQMAKDSSLQGAGCWALGYDDGNTALWNNIRNVFNRENPDNHFVVQVNTTALNIRTGPGTQYTAISYANEGEKFIAFDYIGNWYKIYFPSASGPKYCWMYGGDGTNYQYLKGSSEDSVIKITASLLNVRSYPSTDSSVITQITEDQVFVLDSTDGSWGKIFLPNTNDYYRGWCYYSSYSILYNSIEDSNTFNSDIISIDYPDTVSAGDTFSVIINVKNYGSPFDYKINFSSINDSSVFYYSPNWTNTKNAITNGFDGLPNQTFTRICIMHAPNIENTSFTDSFYFSRYSSSISDTVEISIYSTTSSALQDSSYQYEIKKKSLFKIDNTFENNFHLIIENYNTFSFDLYDIMGRNILSLHSKNINTYFGQSLKRGIYYYIFKSNNFIKTGKILKINK